MPPDEGLIAQLAEQHGLARAPLFRPGEVLYSGDHEVLLDGAFGSFALSVGDDIDSLDAISWAWSSNMPHHVLIRGDEVEVLRWDQPGETVLFDRRRIFEQPRSFYQHLRQDRIKDSRTIVEHSIRMFRTVRSMVDHSGIEDHHSIAAYLLLLASLVSGHEPFGESLKFIEQTFDLPIGAGDVVAQMPHGALEALMSQFGSLSFGNQQLTAFPILAVRHASGPIFQEAHFQLVQGSSPDLLSYVAPARVSPLNRGAVHFTPPSLARSLCEQALIACTDLAARKQVVIADIACGSGAFLIEALRALERSQYKGHVTIVGRDTSPIAIDMARFIIGIAAREWPGHGRYKLDLQVGDTLRDVKQPPADVLVMNPPFVPWQELRDTDRRLLRSILGPDAHGRPDLSMAFVMRALDSLTPQGALATLLPANLLEAKSTAGWRRNIMERRSIYLTALFDDQEMFSHARVRVGALVLSPTGFTERVEIRAGGGPDDTGDALRALRRGNDNSSADESFSLRRVNEIQKPVSWTTGASATRELTHRSSKTALSSLGSLFNVQQGIRTGENAAFVLTDAQLNNLPASEQIYFRPTITSRNLIDGKIVRLSHLFYPYDDPSLIIKGEKELLEKLPDYYSRYLRVYRKKLAVRRGRSERWWELSERRPGLELGQPIFVSKYWARPGGIVLRVDRRTVVLQGFGWIASDRLKKSLFASEKGVSDIAAAYLAIFNTQTFFSLLAEYAPPTGGGQLDMSPRYVRDVPLVDLTLSQNIPGNVIKDLAEFSRCRYLGLLGSTNISDERVEEEVALLFGLGRRNPSAETPLLTALDLLNPSIAAGLQGPEREDQVQLLVSLQDLASKGAYDKIDAVLSQAPLSSLANTSLITLLRGTYRFKSKLLDWVGFRDRVAVELKVRGMSADKLLMGLYS